MLTALTPETVDLKLQPDKEPYCDNDMDCCDVLKAIESEIFFLVKQGYIFHRRMYDNENSAIYACEIKGRQVVLKIVIWDATQNKVVLSACHDLID